MLANSHEVIAATKATTAVSMKDRQAPLMKRYAQDPEQAWVIDRATTSSKETAANQPLRSQVTYGTGFPATQSIGVHKAVGGNCDYPNPGEMLAAAIASCFDSTTRIIANRLGIPLIHLQVDVATRVDVRGTLRVDHDVPVGFQTIDIKVDIQAADGVTPAQIDMILKAAEHSCVVLQTLRLSPDIQMNRGQLPN